MERPPRLDHPVIGPDRETAEESFHTAICEGSHGGLWWTDVDGDDVTGAELHEDLLAHAHDGPWLAGCSEEEANYYLKPLRKRAEMGVMLADWKRVRVSDALDGGGDFRVVLRETQREYIERWSESLPEGVFSDWF